MEEFARRCSELIRPSMGPYIEVPHMGHIEDVRRVVSQLRSGLIGPIAAALNALTGISADATDPVSTQDWPGLVGALVGVVRGGLEFDSGRDGTLGTATAGAGSTGDRAVDDHALWAEVEALAGTNEAERAMAGELAAAALNVLRNLSLTPSNRAAMATDAGGALAPLLVRCIAAAVAGGGVGAGDEQWVNPGAAADAADVLVNLAWLDDDAPLNAPTLLTPTENLADAACAALETPTPSPAGPEMDEGAEFAAGSDAALRCAAAGLLGFAATCTIDGEVGGWRDDAFARRAVDALASNVVKSTSGGEARDGDVGGAAAARTAAAATTTAACVRALHAVASNGGDGLGAGPAAVASHPVVIPRLVKLASRRGGAWRECRAASMDALVAAALSTEGRRRLSAHEEDLLRLAVEDRGVAEGPVMLTMSRIAEGSKV